MFFEEFELPAEMVLLDSLNTTNQGVLVVGEEVDDFFGKTSATGYSRLYIENTTPRPKENALLDSIFFHLNVTGVDGQDLDKPKKFFVHKLTEPIKDINYFNFDKVAYEEAPFASAEVTFGKKKDSLLTLSVKEDFAEEIFNKLKLGIEFNDLFSFREYFPGIAVKANEGENTTVNVGLGLKTGMSIYYHYEGDSVSKFYPVITSKSRNFNGITSDRSGTPTEIITEASKTYDIGTKVGMKAGVGLVIKVDTSPFDQFLDTLGGVTFNQVAISVGGIDEQLPGENPISYFSLYFTDEANKFLSNSNGDYFTVQADAKAQVINKGGDSYEPAVGNFAFVDYDLESKIYSEQLASYMNAVFRGSLTRKDWILYGGYVLNENRVSIDPDLFRRSIRQFVVDKNKIKVKVVYSKSN